VSFPNLRTYAFDANTQVSDNAAAYTASGYLQSGGADGIWDLGGNQGATVTLPSIADSTTYTPQQARIDAMMILDVTAITVSGTQTYQIDILVSNDPAFAAGNVVCAGGIQLGKGSSLRGPVAQKDSVIGRCEVPFTNNIAGSIYQYVKVYLTGANTPSINILAFGAVLPEP
jgi:hypothetical protein